MNLISKREIVFFIGLLLACTVTAEAKSKFKPFVSELMRGGDEAKSVSVDVTGVKVVYLSVTVGPDNYDSDQAIWAEPKLIDRNGKAVDLTTVKPTFHKVGWGRLFINTNQNKQPLRIADERFTKGFWAHGPSVLQFDLGGKYVRFEARVGIDKGAGSKGSVVFKVTNTAPKPILNKRTKKTKKAPDVTANVLPADQSPHTFNAKAASILRDKGIDQLVFVRRFTLTANHVYTEYVNSRWLPGGGLAVLDLKTGVARDLVPSLGKGVVNRFDISYDAKTIVFDYKKSQGEGYRIYEVGIDGKGLKQLTFPQKDEAELVRKYGSRGYHHSTDDLHPCYLPDGGIVFVTTRCQYGILCDAGDNFTTKNLYRMEGDGKNMRPLSHSPVSEASPAIMPDGRILYHRWEYVDKAAGNVKCLWSMKPDGTASSEIYGNTITFPETMIYPRPIPGADGKIVMLGTSHWINNAMGTVIVIDTSDDIRAVDTMKFVTKDIHALAHNGFHFRDANGQWKFDKTGKNGRLFKDPYPISEDLFIAARKPKGPAWSDPLAYSLVLLDGQGVDTPLYEDKQISCWHPYPLMPRKRPAASSSPINRELAKKNLALCVMTDVYTGMSGVERGSVKYLRVLEEVPRPWAVRKSWYKDDRDGMAHTALGEGHLGLKVQYGVVPVEEDGSAHFYVPSERNVYLQALDENFLMLQTERTYVHYMPGETRSCIGCHETPDQASRHVSSNTLLAMKRAPSMPSAQTGETAAKKLFDYDRQIQPIWNKHCLDCHSAAEPQGNLSLVGDPQGVYSVSYNNLIKLGKSNKQTLGNRKLRDEDVGSAGAEYLPPYSVGAVTSPLAAMLSHGRIKLRNPALQSQMKKLIEAHESVRLSDAEFLAVTNWLDVNCPYHPSYWGRLNAKYKSHPNYRPNVTFTDAISRSVPKSILLKEAAAGKE